MDSQQARDILLRYRPGTADDDDPDVREALECARNDPELGRWLEEHRARQSQIRARLKQIPVPRDLRREILDAAARQKVIVRWQRPAFRAWAAAAAIILVAGVIFWWTKPAPYDFATYRQNVVGRFIRMYPPMDMETNNLAAIRQYLDQHRGHGDYALPAGLQNVTSTGCKIFSSRSKHVSLICFASTNRTDLYFFVINRSDVSNPPPQDAPQIARIGSWTSASWSKGDKTYILAGDGDETFVRRYL